MAILFDIFCISLIALIFICSNFCSSDLFLLSINCSNFFSDSLMKISVSFFSLFIIWLLSAWAHAESNQIINNEKKETEIFIKESEKKFEQLIDNKKRSLEQKLEQMKIKAIKDMQNISNKIAIEAVKKIISGQENSESIKTINQKNLGKTFDQLKEAKLS